MATGYTLTAPTPANGPVSDASGLFTITFTGGATDGTATITLSDGGAGGTFKNALTNGTVTTLTPANGVTTAYFNYTPPSSASAQTISTTNNKAWTDPSGVTFTSRANSGSTTCTKFSPTNVVFTGDALGGTDQGHNRRLWGYSSGWMEFKATGTRIEIQWANGGSPKVSIDGGAWTAFTTPTIPGLIWNWYTVGDGLSDAQHTVQIAACNSTTETDTDFVVRVTGSAPAVAAPDYNGPQYFPADVAATTFITEGAYKSTGNVSGFSSHKLYILAGEDNTIRFKATITNGATNAAIRVFRNDGFSDSCRLAVDDVDTGSGGTFVGSTGLTEQWMTFTSGIPADGVEHEYCLSFCNTVNALAGYGGYNTVYIIQVNGGTANTSTGPSTRSKVWSFYGDSITQCIVGTANDSSLGWPHRLALAYQAACSNNGLGGTTTSSNFSGSNSGQSRTGFVTGLSPTPNKVWVLYGSNDMGIGSASITQAQFASAYQAMMNSLTTGLPSAHFYCLGILPRSDKTAAQMASYNSGGTNSITTAIASLTSGQQSQITFIDTSPLALAGSSYNSGGSFSNSPNYGNYGSFTADGLHPNPSGNLALVNFLRPWAAATGFSVSGPSSSYLGQASTNLTVTIETGSSFTGTWTITLTASSGDTITATAASGSINGNGTGTVVVSPAAIATSFTFTYTANSVGSRSVNYTNGQGWTNPSASTLTATDPDSSSSSTSSASSASSASSNSSSSSSSPSSASSASSDSSSHSSASSASTDSSSSLSSASSESSDSSSLSSESSSSSASSESSESVTFIPPTPTIISVHPIDVPDDGDDIIIYNRPFEMTISELDPDAFVNAFVNGIFYVAGDVIDVNKARFSGTKLPLGRKQLTITQVVDGNESDSSASRSVRINRADNVVGRLPAPTITPAGGTFFSFPVTVTITSSVGGDILYVVDGTGYSQPTILYTGPFKMYQTGVVRARVMYQGQKGESTIQTIRIVR